MFVPPPSSLMPVVPSEKVLPRLARCLSMVVVAGHSANDGTRKVRVVVVVTPLVAVTAMVSVNFGALNAQPHSNRQRGRSFM